MNPETQQLEPVTPETPKDWEQLHVGQLVEAFIHSEEGGILFKVIKIEESRITLHVVERPGAGKRWALKHIAYGVPVTIGKMKFIKAGATNRTIRLNVIGVEE